MVRTQKSRWTKIPKTKSIIKIKIKEKEGTNALTIYAANITINTSTTDILKILKEWIPSPGLPKISLYSQNIIYIMTVYKNYIKS